MNGWKLCQFKNIVNTFLEDCDPNMQEALEERLYLLSDKGNMCKRPVSESLGDGLFALRAKENRQQVRLIYYFKPNKVVNFVHVFYKTTKKISHRDIRIAKKNRKIIEEEERIAYKINLTN